MRVTAKVDLNIIKLSQRQHRLYQPQGLRFSPYTVPYAAPLFLHQVHMDGVSLCISCNISVQRYHNLRVQGQHRNSSSPSAAYPCNFCQLSAMQIRRQGHPLQWNPALWLPALMRAAGYDRKQTTSNVPSAGLCTAAGDLSCHPLGPYMHTHALRHSCMCTICASNSNSSQRWTTVAADKQSTHYLAPSCPLHASSWQRHPRQRVAGYNGKREHTTTQHQHLTPHEHSQTSLQVKLATILPPSRHPQVPVPAVPWHSALRRRLLCCCLIIVGELRQALQVPAEHGQPITCDAPRCVCGRSACGGRREGGWGSRCAGEAVLCCMLHTLHTVQLRRPPAVATAT